MWTFNSSILAPLATSRTARAPCTAISRVGAIIITWTEFKSSLIMFKALMTKTRVFPVPDLAWMTKSRPRLAKGRDFHWTGDGETYLASVKPKNNWDYNFKYLIKELEGITSRKGGSFCFLYEKRVPDLAWMIKSRPKWFKTILSGKNQGNFEFGFGKI